MQTSIWEKESFFASRDVIIIGSGLAGLWCGYELLANHPKLNLLIVDKGVVPSGASTRNAGFACFGSPTELISDAKNMGEDRMWELAEMRYRGIEKIKNTFSSSLIDFDNCGGYECLQKEKDNIEEIEENLVWLNKGLQRITGETKTFCREDEKLRQFGLQGFDALLHNSCEGGLHSGKLVAALQQKIVSLGGQILQNIQVTRWDDVGSGVELYCANSNIQLKTSRLIICTNALDNALLKGIKTEPQRGQILVTSPIENLAVRGTFHYDEGFYYFRNVGNRILLGGARNKAFDEENTSAFETTEIIQQTLQNFLTKHILPNQIFTIDYRWSGIMGFTEDKQPLIKQITNRVTAMIICNGMGVALSPVMAEKIEL